MVLEQKLGEVKAKTLIPMLVGINVTVFASVFVHVHVCFCVTKLQQERDELYKTFTQNVEKVQHNAGLKITQLEKRMSSWKWWLIRTALSWS